MKCCRSPNEHIKSRLSALYPQLSSQEQDSLASLGDVLSVSSGRVLLQEGELDSALYLLLHGRALVYKTSVYSGKQVVLADLQAGDPIGEVAVLTKGPRSAHVQILEDAQLLRLSEENLSKHSKNHSGLLYFLSERLAQRLQASSEKVADLHFEDVPERLMKLLRHIARSQMTKLGASSEDMLIRALPSQKELAHLLGVSRETISRALCTLEESKLIRRVDRETCWVA